jgi:hypothetical protein
MNRTERGFVPGLSIGAAAIAFRDFFSIAHRLSEGEQKELSVLIDGIKEEFAGGYRSLAEAPDGSGETMAGIGVVNANVVPAAILAKGDEGKGASVGNDPAWGDTPPATVEAPAEAKPLDNGANINGQALTDQLGEAGGWGTETPSTKTAEEANSGNGGGTGDNA